MVANEFTTEDAHARAAYCETFATPEARVRAIQNALLSVHADGVAFGDGALRERLRTAGLYIESQENALVELRDQLDRLKASVAEERRVYHDSQWQQLQEARAEIGRLREGAAALRKKANELRDMADLIQTIQSSGPKC